MNIKKTKKYMRNCQEKKSFHYNEETVVFKSRKKGCICSGVPGYKTKNIHSNIVYNCQNLEMIKRFFSTWLPKDR